MDYKLHFKKKKPILPLRIKPSPNPFRLPRTKTLTSTTANLKLHTWDLGDIDRVGMLDPLAFGASVNRSGRTLSTE